jgi:hypothetical protein
MNHFPFIRGVSYVQMGGSFESLIQVILKGSNSYSGGGGGLGKALVVNISGG